MLDPHGPRSPRYQDQVLSGPRGLPQCYLRPMLPGPRGSCDQCYRTSWFSNATRTLCYHGSSATSPSATSANTSLSTANNSSRGVSGQTLNSRGSTNNTKLGSKNLNKKVSNNKPGGNNDKLSLKNAVNEIKEKGSGFLENTTEFVDNVQDGKYNKWGFIFVIGISLILIIHFLRYIITSYYHYG